VNYDGALAEAVVRRRRGCKSIF